MNPKNRILIFAVIGSLAATPGIIFGLTPSHLVNAASNSENLVATSNPPLNATAFTSKPDLADRPLVYVKWPGMDMHITAEVNNPVVYSGTVTDPNGVVHPMTLIAVGNGKMQLHFKALLSDPDGNYTVNIHIVRGPNTSDLSIGADLTNYAIPQTPPSSNLPP